MPVEPQAPYISSKEAAKKYGLTNDHIGLLCRRGKIQGLLWGRVWFVSEPSLKGYIQKNLELKEARRAALSKQWRGAWTVAFIAFFLFAASGDYASADFVSMPARVVAKVEASPLSLTALVAKVGELKELVPAPQIPELPKPVVNQVNTSNNSFISNVHEGLAAVGESISNIFAVEPEAAPAYKMRVTYAKDIEPQLTAQEPISLFLTAAVINAGAVAATLPAPQLTYEAPHVEPLLTAENLLAGMMLANETLSRLNDNMFALYLESFNSFAEVVAFDASAGAHVWEKTFGAFGERFVSDLAQLNDLQVSFYFAAADELDEAYNSFADSVEGSHMFDSSISVASVSLAPSMTIPGEKQVAAVWDGWIDFLAGTLFSANTESVETCAT